MINCTESTTEEMLLERLALLKQAPYAIRDAFYASHTGYQIQFGLLRCDT